MHVRVPATAQEADNSRYDAFLAERHSVVVVEAADRDRLGDVVTQQLVRLAATFLSTFLRKKIRDSTNNKEQGIS